MAKDPAFLFYSSDFITGVQVLSMAERGKYITILCLMHQQGRLSEETIRFLVGSVSVKLKSKFSIDEHGLWYNKRLEEEALKRKKFWDSRTENGKKGGRPKKNSEKPLGFDLVNLTEDENINRIIEQLESSCGPIEKQKTNAFMYLVVEMAKTFMEANPEYYFDKETDYSACLQISYKIAAMKKWMKADVVDKKMKDCLAAWKKIVEFIKNDDWFRTRSLSDVSTVKEWQRLVQKMTVGQQSGSSEKKMVL